MGREVAAVLTPRGLSREEAAEYCGLSVPLFSAKVEAGTLPGPLDWGGRTKVWDRAALDRALDRLSGIASQQPGDEWMKSLGDA